VRPTLCRVSDAGSESISYPTASPDAPAKALIPLVISESVNTESARP